jgi:hypothetical protein
VCFVLNRLKLHILVVHLHAHSSIDREAEATYIQTQIIEGVIEEKYGAGAFIAIMGDMNSLSSVDAKHHEELGLVQTMSTFEPQVSTHLRHIVERGRICVYVMDVFLPGLCTVHQEISYIRQDSNQLQASRYSDEVM